MKIRVLAVSAVLGIVLTGCVQVTVLPGASSEPSSSPSSSPSVSPSSTPDALVLVIPGSCDNLVALSVVHAQFATSFEPLPLMVVDGDPVAQDFVARGGLTCAWGIPNSDAGFVSVFVAERATASDADLVGQWQAAGYSECPPFLDACYSEVEINEIGQYWTAHVLVEGFEIRVMAASTSLDPLLVMARAAATSMGYV